jgi:FkbM family methyltransferase
MKKIVLDCGSHLGESIKKFKSILPDADQFEYYMFEPNTYLFNTILETPEFNECKKYNVAVSNKKEKVKLWGCLKNKQSVGSTLQKSKATWDNIEENDYLEIDSINLAEFIKEQFSRDDFIILKLDIEGAEYDVLPELIRTDVIGYIDKLYCEFHSCWMSREFIEKEQQIIKSLKDINLEISYWDALS